MASYGWMINLTGDPIPVYSVGGSGPSNTQIGTLTRNECFVEGSLSTNPWEGEGVPVIFLNSSHTITFGLINNPNSNGLVDFVNYASNGTSWVAVTTLERKVQYATVAYNADGSRYCELPAGSRVWLSSNGTAGQSNPNYIAVTKIKTPSGVTHTFPTVGFIDLTYNNRWVNVGSILLRKV